MIKHIKFLTFILSLGLLTGFLASCNKDDGGGNGPGGGGISDEERAVLDDMLGTWTVSEVTQDGEVPQIGDYSSMSVTFDANLEDGSDKTYSVTDGGPAFPTVSGASWSFVNGTNFSVIQREDGTAMSVTELDATTLVLQQDVDEEVGDGRVATIGRYIYTFSQ